MFVGKDRINRALRSIGWSSWVTFEDIIDHF